MSHFYANTNTRPTETQFPRISCEMFDRPAPLPNPQLILARWNSAPNAIYGDNPSKKAEINLKKKGSIFLNGIPFGIDEVANSDLMADRTRCNLINEVTAFIYERHELQEDNVLDNTKCCGPKGAKTK